MDRLSVMAGLLALVTGLLWWGIFEHYERRKDIAIDSWQALQMQLVEKAARTVEAWMRVRTREQRIPEAEAKKEAVSQFIAPLQLLDQGTPWVYNDQEVVHMGREGFPAAYGEISIEEAFARQAQKGARHYEAVVQGVTEAVPGTGWYVWDPERGPEYASWTSAEVAGDIWVIGLSMPESVILGRAGLPLDFRRDLVGVTVITALTFTVLLLLTRNVTVLERTVRERTQDLTEANEALNMELMERQRAEAAAREAEKAAEMANAAKSEFIANVSHELRTPLNGILGYTQILQRDQALDEKQQKAVNIIHRSGEHLLMVINDILDLSKIELRKMDLHLRDFSLVRLLESISELIQVQVENKGLALDTDFDPDLPEVVRGDEVRLRQILLNLLGNAVKYTEEGRIGFGARARAARGNGHKQAEICFEVKDTGIGIPPEKLKMLFKPFKQADNRKDTVEGTGLGLAISSRLVRMMESWLHVESDVGEGTRFWFTIRLPVVGVADPALEVDESPSGAEDRYKDTIEEGVWTPPPPAELNQLFDLAMRGDVRAIQQRAEKLAASEGYTLFGQKIYHYAKALMVDELQEFIGKFTEVQR
jgi:signal transduction histidine kinase